MISSASSFLSFSFRFFILQILRFINMRDWLAIPLSPTSASVKNSDDEYDIVNRATTTEEESDGIEEEVEAADNAESDADKFTLVSILNAFIDIGKEQLKTRSLSISSSGASSQYNDSNERSIQQLEVKKKPVIITNREIDGNKENEICIGAITDDEEGYNHDEDDIDDDDSINNDDDEEEEQEFDNNEYTSELKRTLSNSSLASSTDTDNSTPASSQIMGPSTSKQLFNMSTINKSLVEICWNHGGKKVQVTGEFDNWSGSVDMVQDTENTQRHVTTVPIDSTKDIEFKFIVDGEWKYAIDLPHRTDWRGNVNNVFYKKTSSLL